MKFTTELTEEEVKALIELKEFRLRKGEDFIDEDLKLEVASLTQLNKALLKEIRRVKDRNSILNLAIPTIIIIFVIVLLCN